MSTGITMRHHAIATEDGFDPGHPLPLFLLRADEPEQGIGNDKAVISLRGFAASLLVAAAIATGIAFLSDQVTLFATASLVDKSAPQPGTQPTATIQSAVIQSTDVVEALPPTAKEALTREMAAASEPASQTQKENDEVSSEALFREFQAWAAKQDAHALAKPVQDGPAPAVENAPAPVQPMQKRQRARSLHNARAEIRHVREHRANVQHRRVRARPVQEAQAQTQSVQNAEPPSLLESLNPFASWPTLTNR